MNQRKITTKDDRIIRPWVIFVGIGISIILLIITCLSVYLFNLQSPLSDNPKAMVRYIPAPTATETSISQNSEIQLTATSQPPGQNLSIGCSIRIEGTGGSGLRLRSEAGLSNKILHLIHDGEELIIDDGPKEIDGYTWWHVKSPTDSTISGWGVDNYMVKIQIP